MHEAYQQQLRNLPQKIAAKKRELKKLQESEKRNNSQSQFSIQRSGDNIVCDLEELFEKDMFCCFYTHKKSLRQA